MLSGLLALDRVDHWIVVAVDASQLAEFVARAPGTACRGSRSPTDGTRGGAGSRGNRYAVRRLLTSPLPESMMAEGSGVRMPVPRSGTGSYCGSRSGRARDGYSRRTQPRVGNHVAQVQPLRGCSIRRPGAAPRCPMVTFSCRLRLPVLLGDPPLPGGPAAKPS